MRPPKNNVNKLTKNFICMLYIFGFRREDDSTLEKIVYENINFEVINFAEKLQKLSI